MPYPVLPPDPPPIVQPAPIESLSVSSAVSSTTASADVAFPVAPASSTTQAEQPSSHTPSSHSPSRYTPTSTTPSMPEMAPPESFFPESQRSVSEPKATAAEAAALGQPLAIDYRAALTRSRVDPSPHVAKAADTPPATESVSYSSTVLPDLSADRLPSSRTSSRRPSALGVSTASPSLQFQSASLIHSDLAHSDFEATAQATPTSETRPTLEIPTPTDDAGDMDEEVDEDVNEDLEVKDKTGTSDEAGQTDAAEGAAEGTEETPITLEEAIVELQADRQEYDAIRRIFQAEGNVVMRYGGAVLDAQALQVNLIDRIAVAEGNVALTRGEQVVRGNRFEYNFVQETGTVQGASGEIFLPTSGEDFTPPLPSDVTAWQQRPPSDRITAAQPVQGVQGVGQLTLGLGSGQGAGQQGEVRRVRFEAEEIDFYPEGWVARNIRITNDPFSPPELEVRAEEAVLNRISPLQDELLLENPRLVLDQGLQLPILRDRIVIDRRERQPAILTFGFDEGDRGGFFIERDFEFFASDRFRLVLTPQFYAQRAFDEGFGDPSTFGFIAQVDGAINPRTSLTGRAELTTLDPEDIEDELRASTRLRHNFPTGLGTHTLALEYSYRDRLFNGSLGFQDVRQSLGAVVTSPFIPLGDTGIGLSYQAGAQYITADTDQLDLLDPIRTNNRVSLGRFQTSAALSRGFPLWRGEPLPATPDEGLRYTPQPIVPYLSIFTGVLGVATGYTNGDTQNSLTGTVGLQGQFGHFSRNFFDYTAFSVAYSDALVSGQSPFFFDRLVDQRTLSLGITQQIYGPIRFGFQTAVNLDTDTQISTDYILEYSRRTHGVVVRYNPEQEIGSISLRISDFNWDGTPEPFGGSGVAEVESGVIRSP